MSKPTPSNNRTHSLQEGLKDPYSDSEFVDGYDQWIDEMEHEMLDLEEYDAYYMSHHEDDAYFLHEGEVEHDSDY
jgi:hypothetical protein